MSLVHRDKDARVCGAKTVTTATTVYIEGQLVALDDDPNTHGDGNIIATGYTNVYMESKKVAVKGDNAKGDNATHSNPYCTGSASNTYVG